MNYAWPTAQIAVMGAKGAVEIIFRADIGDADKIAARTKEYEDRFLSPFVAAERGYIDDVIMPHQIRLQREDVLLEIAKKAKARLELEAFPTKPVPLKVLVPYREKASLEDINSDLVQAWANLLVEAAENYDPKLNVYADILGKIGGKDANFLSQVCLASNYRNGVSWPAGHFKSNENCIRQKIHLLDQSANKKLSPNKFSSDELSPYWLQFKKEAKLEYGYVIHGVVLTRENGALFFYNSDFMFVDGLTIDRLEAERLVRRTVITFVGSESITTGSVSYLELSYLAIDLVRVCTRNFSMPIVATTSAVNKR